MATGRRPAIGRAGPDTVGVTTTGRGAVESRTRGSGPLDWLYAVGDVNGRALLTHLRAVPGPDRRARDRRAGRRPRTRP
ncbi:hypothetical protein HBB16_21090 [Pseudonocardia sp. MCCB 268]|nr:hypothetical protein [Pseudonocardia cytotoxica]